VDNATKKIVEFRPPGHWRNGGRQGSKKVAPPS
jgi:hypothetical protein